MRRKGNCWDAPSESFFNSLKNERVHGTRYETRDAARADVFEYMAAPIAAKRCSRRMSSSGRPSDLLHFKCMQRPRASRGVFVSGLACASPTCARLRFAH
jgi:hypothetical protein